MDFSELVDAANFVVRPFGWLVSRGAELFARLRHMPYRRKSQAGALSSLRRRKPR